MSDSAKKSLASLNQKIEIAKFEIKIIENFLIIEETFINREKFAFTTLLGDILTIWSNCETSLWSNGNLNFSQIKHYKEIYKICKGVSFEDKELERFLKAENFFKNQIKINKELVMNVIYNLE